MKKEVLREEIKNFSLNININKYKDFVDFFYSINDDAKNDIIYYMINYKKYSNNIKNGNLDKIYNIYHILLHKLKYDKLNFKEKYIYEHIKSYEIISGEFNNDELFEKYVKEYLNNISRFNFKNRIFIILQDLINKLNKENNKKYSLTFIHQESIASTDWLEKEYKEKICLSIQKYYDYYNMKTFDEVNILYFITTNCFIILHEYKHLLQNDYLRNNNDELSKLYKYELFNLFMNHKLYEKNHNSYYIETEANDYALNNFFKYIKCYFQDKCLNEKELNECIYKNFDLCTKNKKIFLLKYKVLKKYLSIFEKKQYKPMKLILFNEKFNEKI